MGVQKLLLPYGESTFIETIVRNVSQSGLGPAHVVVGRDSEVLRQTLTPYGVHIIDNPDYDSGMLSSIRAGLRAAPDATGYAVLLGDQPQVGADLIRIVAEAFDETCAPIVAPAYKGKRGHPLIFAGMFKQEILTCFDEVGLRGLLQSHPDQIHEIPVDRPGILEDIDTPEDYERLMSGEENAG